MFFSNPNPLSHKDPFLCENSYFNSQILSNLNILEHPRPFFYCLFVGIIIGVFKIAFHEVFFVASSLSQVGFLSRNLPASFTSLPLMAASFAFFGSRFIDRKKVALIPLSCFAILFTLLIVKDHTTVLSIVVPFLHSFMMVLMSSVLTGSDVFFIFPFTIGYSIVSRFVPLFALSESTYNASFYGYMYFFTDSQIPFLLSLIPCLVFLPEIIQAFKRQMFWPEFFQFYLFSSVQHTFVTLIIFPFLYVLLALREIPAFSLSEYLMTCYVALQHLSIPIVLSLFVHAFYVCFHLNRIPSRSFIFSLLVSLLLQAPQLLPIYKGLPLPKLMGIFSNAHPYQFSFIISSILFVLGIFSFLSFCYIFLSGQLYYSVGFMIGIFALAIGGFYIFPVRTQSDLMVMFYYRIFVSGLLITLVLYLLLVLTNWLNVYSSSLQVNRFVLPVFTSLLFHFVTEYLFLIRHYPPNTPQLEAILLSNIYPVFYSIPVYIVFFLIFMCLGLYNWDISLETPSLGGNEIDFSELVEEVATE